MAIRKLKKVVSSDDHLAKATLAVADAQVHAQNAASTALTEKDSALAAAKLFADQANYASANADLAKNLSKVLEATPI